MNRRQLKRRGSLIDRGGGTYLIRVSTGRLVSSKTNPSKRVRERLVETFHGTETAAQKRLTALLKQKDDGQTVMPSKITVAWYCDLWLSIKSSKLAANTVDRYTSIIRDYVTPSPLGALPIQKVRVSDLERYFGALQPKLTDSTQTLHVAVLMQSFEKAEIDNVIVASPFGKFRTNKPSRKRTGDRAIDLQQRCWTLPEVHAFLARATTAGPRQAAMYAFALDSGARKGEILGLRWADVAFDKKSVTVRQQLLKIGETPTFGPTKTGKQRTITLAPETVALLKAWKQRQAQIHMAHADVWQDYDLVFADDFGRPLNKANIGQREFEPLVKEACVKVIRFHDMRHTCASHLLLAGEPPLVVKERLGHAKVTMTLEVYAHCMPDSQQSAASTISRLFHG